MWYVLVLSSMFILLNWKREFGECVAHLLIHVSLLSGQTMLITIGFPSTIVVIFVPGLYISKPQKIPIEHMVKMRTIWAIWSCMSMSSLFLLRNLDRCLKEIVFSLSFWYISKIGLFRAYTILMLFSRLMLETFICICRHLL